MYFPVNQTFSARSLTNVHTSLLITGRPRIFKMISLKNSVRAVYASGVCNLYSTYLAKTIACLFTYRTVCKTNSSKKKTVEKRYSPYISPVKSEDQKPPVLSFHSIEYLQKVSFFFSTIVKFGSKFLLGSIHPLIQKCVQCSSRVTDLNTKNH